MGIEQLEKHVNYYYEHGQIESSLSQGKKVAVLEAVILIEQDRFNLRQLQISNTRQTIKQLYLKRRLL